MTFLWPYMLFFLLFVPLLVGIYFLVLRRKKRAAIRYANLNMVKTAMGSGSRFRRHIPPLLFLLGVVILIFAIARPAAVVTLPSQRGTVILAMDISGSMRATDVAPSRIVASQEAASAFVGEQPGNVRIGIVAFAATSSVVQAPTTNREEAFAAIERFQTQYGTAVGAGILTSLATIFEDDESIYTSPEPRSYRGAPLGQLRQREEQTYQPVPPGTYTSAVIVLLTDGETTTGPDPLEAAALAAERGVRIFTVGLGTEEGEIVGFGGRSMRVRLDAETLMAIADRTGGEYFSAASRDELKRIYQALSTQLTLETEKTEITALFAALAAVAVVLSGMLSLLWFNRLV